MATSNLHKWASLPDPSPADLARAAEGDAEAFKLIVERYQGMVYSVAYNVLGNHTDAEDAAQEAFLRCYRKLPQFRSEATFSTWLFRLALTAVRGLQAPRAAPPGARGGAGAGRRRPSPQLGEGIDAATIVAALHDLPEDYRVPTVLRDVYGLPYQEIAETTGRPLGTVKVMVHRGRASLRLKLRAGGVGPDQGPAGAVRERRLMDCSYFRERINHYVDGELGYLEVAELQAHLSFCPDCAAELAQLGEVRGALAAWGRLELAPPPGFAERVMAAVELEPAPGSPKPFGRAVEDALAEARRHAGPHPAARRPHHPRQERHRLGPGRRRRGHRPRERATAAARGS